MRAMTATLAAIRGSDAYEVADPEPSGRRNRIFSALREEPCRTIDEASGMPGYARDRWVSINWIGGSTFKTLQPTIDEHEMWIYEVEGHYIESRRAETFLIWAGERYSALVQLDKKPMDYSIRVPDGGYL